MRIINYLVIHHSITPRDLDLEKSISSFNRSHTERFPDMSVSLGMKVAYHYVISGDGKYRQTRHENAIGYHASNWNINKHSIGICLTGDFDNEKPSEAQLNTLDMLIKEVKKNHEISIIGHRDIQGVGKSCPGKNFTDEMIDNLDKIEVEAEFLESRGWALKNKVCNDSNWDKPLTKDQNILTQYRVNKLVK